MCAFGFSENVSISYENSEFDSFKIEYYETTLLLPQMSCQINIA